MTTKHDTRCPYCKRFVPADADGFYDYAERCELDADGECMGMPVAAFCSEDHANKFHGRKE